MSIRKQDFYEGAAIYQLVRTGTVTSIGFESPFFLLNNCLKVHLKHCTKKRSPWSFTFTQDEQLRLQSASTLNRMVIGLICGDDGIATLSYEDFTRIVFGKDASVRVACSRNHNEHYSIHGPSGEVDGKVAPSSWLRILTIGDLNETSC